MPRYLFPHPTLILLAALAAGCERAAQDAPAPQQQAAPEQAPAGVMGTVVAMNANWGDAFARGDAAVMAGLYTEEAVLMTPEGDVAGRAAIRDYFAGRFAARADTILRTATNTEVLEVAGDWAYEAGTITFTLAPRDRPAASRSIAARYVTFWQQDPGGWRIRRSLRPLP